MEVLVPEMIIKLKQGIGRLIRSEKDFGIVSIIDSRVGEKSKAKYKRKIWEALPIKNRTSNFDEIEEFYNSLIGQIENEKKWWMRQRKRVKRSILELITEEKKAC